MATKKPKRRSAKARTDPDAHRRDAGGRVTLPAGEKGWRRALLHPGAPKARPLREMLDDVLTKLDGDYRARLANEFPRIDYPAAGIGPDDDVDPLEAWPVLEAMHDHLVDKARAIANSRGSAEWLWLLRRLRGQFHVNTLDSTEPYVQLLAESLTAGVSRPSSHVEGAPTFAFEVTPEVLLDLVWMRNAAIQIYRLHATMKRCAKGQHVRFVEGDVPYAVPDDVFEAAIHDYDQRCLEASSSLLDAVGLHLGTGRSAGPGSDDSFGGTVPFWRLVHAPRPVAPFHLTHDGPPPALLQFIDLTQLPPFLKSRLLTRHHVSLIVLLWACFNIASRDPARLKMRLTPALQWGYTFTPTTNFLHEALDEALGWLRDNPASTIDAAVIPKDVAELLAELDSRPPSAFPPLAGSPVHPSGDFTLVDLAGASHLLFETLIRPADGAGANFWSDQFEVDVQRLIDDTPWAPSGEQRDLIGRFVKRENGTDITNIDALAVQGNDIILVSCKSVASSLELGRGDHKAVRNYRSKAEDAVRVWDGKLAEVQSAPHLLGPWAASAEWNIHGIVVFPAVPYVVDDAARRHRLPLGLPGAVGTSELDLALRRNRRTP